MAFIRGSALPNPKIANVDQQVKLISPPEVPRIAATATENLASCFRVPRCTAKLRLESLKRWKPNSKQQAHYYEIWKENSAGQNGEFLDVWLTGIPTPVKVEVLILMHFVAAMA